MKCSDVTTLLSLYMDRQLEAQQMEQIEKHLNTCGHCIKEYEELKTLLADISVIPQLELPNDFRQSLHLRLEQEAAKMTDSSADKQKSVWDRMKEHKRIPMSIGLVAACTLIIFSTGIFDQFGPEDYSPQKTEITQSLPDSKITAKTPTPDGSDSALQENNQAITSPNNKAAVAEPQSPIQSGESEDSAQSNYTEPQATDHTRFEEAARSVITSPPPKQQAPAKPQQSAVSSTPKPSASANANEDTTAPLAIASDNKTAPPDKALAESATGGRAESIELDAPRVTMSAMPRSFVLARTMFVNTKDTQKVIEALGSIQERITEENDRKVVTLTEEEYKIVEKTIKDLGISMDISYGYENSNDPAHSFKLVIINE